MKIHSMIDGKVTFCPASLGLITNSVVTFDLPVPAGTVFVDATTPSAPSDCRTATRQVIGEPTTPADPYGCGP